MLGGHIRLERLEKPVVMGITHASSIPDVSHLAESIAGVLTIDTPFSPASLLNLEPEDAMREEVLDLMRIIPIAQDSSASHLLMRDTEGWNHIVNTPMLKMAIPWTPLALHDMFPDASVREPRGSARVEPIMNAVLAPNSVPISRPQPPGPQRPVPRLPPAPRPFDRDPTTRRSMHPRSSAHLDGCRPGIDYAFVLDLSDSDDLHSTLETISLANTNEPANISQTFLPAVTSEFLAVGIKTHCEWSPNGDDSAIVHLATWAVAFHRRVAQLRCIQAGVSERNTPDTGSHFQTPDDELMPTLPLIRITGTIWEIMYAVDRGDRIELTYPEPLGCSGTIPQAYSLFLALREIGDWVETTFYDRMNELFPPLG